MPRSHSFYPLRFHLQSCRLLACQYIAIFPDSNKCYVISRLSNLIKLFFFFFHQQLMSDEDKEENNLKPNDGRIFFLHCVEPLMTINFSLFGNFFFIWHFCATFRPCGTYELLGLTKIKIISYWGWNVLMLWQPCNSKS